MGSGILFDFGGTLDADGQPWADRFFRYYLEVGGRAPSSAFNVAFQATDRRLEVGLIEPQDGFTATVSKQVLALADLLPDGRLVDGTGWTARIIDDTRRTVGRNRVVLDSLRDSHSLGVVSNFFGNLRSVLDELGLLGCFHTVTDSNAVGIRKPDPRAFTLTCASMRLSPSECLMVGDNPYADIAPAAALGMTTCWLAPADRPAPEGIEPTHRIDRLDQLVAVVT